MESLSVIDRGIRRCFGEHRCLGNIVRRELLNEKNFEKCDGKVEKLAWITIKSIMKRRMMGEEKRVKIWTKIKSIMRRKKKEKDIYHQFIYKLIFREPIVFYRDFAESGPIWSAHQPVDKDPERAQFHRLRSDGHIVYALLKQEMSSEKVANMWIYVARSCLQIRIHWYYIAEIPHREGVEFDTLWADKFVKLAFAKCIYEVSLEMHSEIKYPLKYMEEYMNRTIIDQFPPVNIAEESQEISKQRPAYFRSSGYGAKLTEYRTLFEYRDVYRPRDEMLVWVPP